MSADTADHKPVDAAESSSKELSKDSSKGSAKDSGGSQKLSTAENAGGEKTGSEKAGAEQTGLVAAIKRLKPRLQALFRTYGWTAVGTYGAFWVVTVVAFVLLTTFGVEFEMIGGQAGVAAGAFVALKITQIPRTALTLVLTPLVARVVAKVRGTKATASDG